MLRVKRWPFRSPLYPQTERSESTRQERETKVAEDNGFTTSKNLGCVSRMSPKYSQNQTCQTSGNMTLESRVRSKNSCPVWRGGVRKSADQIVTRWRSTLLHVRFGEERQGNSPTTPCLLLYSGQEIAGAICRYSVGK